MGYLTSTLARRDLFSWLQLPVARLWHSLLWSDRYNYAGIAATVAGAAEFQSTWNLRNFLPPAVHR